MNNFFNTFKNDWDINPTSTGIFMLNVYRNDKNIDYVCFVEGTSDIPFYKNFKNSPFKNKNIEFIRMKTTYETDEQEDIGKDGVIKNYLNICSDKILKQYLSKCIFLVDNDYEGLVSSNFELYDFDKKRFAITKTYSFENYFFKDYNIKAIFNYFNINDIELTKFLNLLNTFIDDVDEYNRLKSSVVIACKKGFYNTLLPRSSYYSPDEIFHFDFNGKYHYYFNSYLMKKQNEKMMYAISYSDKIKDYYYNISPKFSGTTDFIRGHDLYKFIMVYFKQIFEIDLSPNQNNDEYINVIKQLSVDIDIKNGIGETI